MKGQADTSVAVHAYAHSRLSSHIWNRSDEDAAIRQVALAGEPFSQYHYDALHVALLGEEVVCALYSPDMELLEPGWIRL